MRQFSIYLLFSLSTIMLINCEKNTIGNLNNKIEKTQREILNIVQNSTGESTADCRTRFISGGDDCGPFYTYGIKEIDTLELEKLFDKLSMLKTELWLAQEEKFVCDIISPEKDSLISGKCEACYVDEDLSFNCFD